MQVGLMHFPIVSHSESRRLKPSNPAHGGDACGSSDHFAQCLLPMCFQISPGSPVSARKPSPLRAGQLSVVVTEVKAARMQARVPDLWSSVEQAGP